ncbi:MAG: LuxR C-terminal-related transcriptional regulator [Chloroflexota bacterium]
MPEAIQLLHTKLILPVLRPGLVMRARLQALLDQGLARRLTLVSAPAGYGKTTLLGNWAKSCGYALAWVSLDESDNDPARFLAYFLAALQKVVPTLGERFAVGQALAAYARPGEPRSLDKLIVQLINCLQANASPFVLILDDFHLISEQVVLDFITNLLEHAPAQMHLILATRSDPPLPLARLRARGQLAEVRISDLRFSVEEATALLNQALGLNLSISEVAGLAERTEGWAAGLQMAALALQNFPGRTRQEQAEGTSERERSRRSAFIQAFTGSNRYILDYLVEEVLGRQPESVQSFLLKTSILERLSGPLCDALESSRAVEDREMIERLAIQGEAPALETGQQVLEYLERANLFLLPLDDRREWYRYHRLFADLLRKRLSQQAPQAAVRLHGQAAAWFEQHDMRAEAVEHALAAGDFEHAAALIEQIAQTLLNRGESNTLIRWVRSLPEDCLRARPRLDLVYVASLTIFGQPEELLEAHLDRLTHHPNVAAEVKALRAYKAVFVADFLSAERLARQALEELPERSGFFYNLAVWVSFIGQLTIEDLHQRGAAVEALIRTAKVADQPLVMIGTLCQLADVRMAQGQLYQSQALFQQALDLSVGPQGELAPVAGLALIGLGQLHMEWNELQQASRYLERGIELVQAWREFAAIEGYTSFALCCQAQSDAPGVQRCLEQARQLARAFDATELDDRVVDFIGAQVLFRQGDLSAAERYLQEVSTARLPLQEPAHVGDLVGYDIDQRLRKYERIFQAWVEITVGDPEDALELLDPMLPWLEEQGRVKMLVEVELLRSQALLDLGQVDQAQGVFEHMLALAEPGNFVRTILDVARTGFVYGHTAYGEAGGSPGSAAQALEQLLRRAIQHNVCSAYAGRLLSALEAGAAANFLFAAAPALPSQVRAIQTQFAMSAAVEPLSEREMEVLRLLDSSLTTQEIADRLFVAVSTIRSHLKSIYARLDAHHRAEAVAKARDLHLI